MNGHGSFVVPSLLFTLLATVLCFAVSPATRVEAGRYTPRFEALHEERLELSRQLGEIQHIKIQELTVTAYSPTPEECGPDPQMTASTRKVRPGIIAVSRDLFEQGWVFGKKVYVKDHGVFEIADLMNKRYTQRVDIFIPDTGKAKRFGIKQATVALLSS